MPAYYGLRQDEDVVVFFDFEDQNNYVKNIWLSLNTFNVEQKDSAKKLLLGLSEIDKFIIVDWGWGFLTEIGNEIAIEDYFNKRIEIFSNLSH